MIYTSKATIELFKLEIDKYGDSFSEDTNENELRKVFESMQMESLPLLSNSKIEEIKKRYIKPNEEDNFLKDIVAYVDKEYDFIFHLPFLVI